MSQTYSTRQQDVTGGKVFSSRQPQAAAGKGAAAVLPPGLMPPAAPALAPTLLQAAPPAPTVAPATALVPTPPPVVAQAPAPAEVSIPPQAVAQPPVGLGGQPFAPPAFEPQFAFVLSSQGLPVAQRHTPGAAGNVVVKGHPGAVCQVAASFTGLAPLKDPASQPTLWLIHDMRVPPDLSPADQARLPRGATGTGNLPGAIFTVDGERPTYAADSNTLSVAISPGTFTPGPGGAWQLTAHVDATTSQAFHPLTVLGPAALADINQPLPSGTVLRILTDLYMRPATVFPHFTLQTHFAQRLAAVVQSALDQPSAWLDGTQFGRAAVTLEALVRGTPRLLPTRENCFLMADRRS